MKPLLQLKLANKLNLTRQLQQAIELLPLSLPELQQQIENMLETNPMLELQDGYSEEEEYLDSNHLNLSSDSESLIEKLGEKPVSLRDYLLWQMELLPFSEKDKLIATILIDAINEDGFLEGTLDEITATLQSEFQIELPEMLAVLHRIQHFDPIGVGSQSIEEYIEIQIQQLPLEISWRERGLALVKQHLLPSLAKCDYATIKRKLNLEDEALKAVVHGIKSLKPRPAMKFNQQVLDTRSPDIYTYKKADQWHVKLNTLCRFPLTINQSYADLLKKEKSAHRDLKEKLQEARWFIKSIEKRNETLYKVASYIMNAQKEFLEKGEKAMKPLSTKEISEAVHLHASTISRITTNKYVATQRGIFPLKYFLSNAITSQQGDSSTLAVKALIKKFVSKENPLKPLSDNKLMNMLNNHGIHLARRTIAKYRELLRIPSSEKRKQFV